MSIDRLQTLVDNAKKIVFFGGAGVSTQSGIPDFRSADGLCNERGNFSPEQILSHNFFFNHTELFYQFYLDKMIHPNAKPNITHQVLAQLEQQGKLLAVITQNIDGLHQAAGSQVVHELHGSVHRNTCVQCKIRYTLDYLIAHASAPYCRCGALIKPDVVLYGESLDAHTIEQAIEALSQADLLIIGGTSLNVYPAAGLIDYYQGQQIVLINKEPTAQDGRASLLLAMALGDVFGSLTLR